MALSSPINLSSIKQSVGGLNSTASFAKASANKSIGILANRTKIKSKLIFGDRAEFYHRREIVRRKKQNTALTISTLGNFINRSSVVLADTAKGFLGRILDFIGTLLTGWLLYNLPSIISMAHELMGRIQRLVGILGAFMRDINNSIVSFGNLLGAVIKDITSFDFFDTSHRVQDALDDFNSNFDDMNKQINDGLKLFNTPLTEGLITGDNAAPFGTDYTTQPGLPDGNSPEMYRIAAALSTEGTGSQSNVDMMQVVANRKATGRYGATYTDILAAPGQFTGVEKRSSAKFRKIQTLDDAAKWSGQSKQTLLKIIKDIQNPTLQSNSANFVSGALEYRASPQNNPNGRLPGTAWRGGAGDNQFLTDASRGDPIKPGGAAQFNFPAPVVSAKTAPSPSNQVSTTVIDQFKGKPGGAAGVITSERGMRLNPRTGKYRMHEGIDIAPAGPGYYVSLKLSGTVDYVGFDSGGYGNFVDIKSGGTLYRFAHLARKFVTKGQSYNGQTIGEIGRTGSATGIHLHFEVRPEGGKSVNPHPYLNLLSIGTKVSGVSGKPVAGLPPTPNAQISTPAQISMQQSINQQLPNQITPERTGQKIMIIDATQPQQIQQPVSNSQTLPFIPPQSNSLNTFIKQKLLTELAYL